MKKERMIYLSIIALLLALLTATFSAMTVGAFSQKELNKFDLDEDGTVSIRDVTHLLNFLSGAFHLDDKNGLYDEDGGVRFYTDDEMQTGFVEYEGATLYFDPESGLMVTQDRVIDGKLYIFEAYTSGERTLYAAREAKNGFYEEDGGVRFYTDDEMQTGFVSFNGKKLYFEPETGLMRTTELTVGDDDYFAPTAFEHEGLTLYGYGDPIPEPRVDTAAWAAYISEHGSSVRVPDKQMPAGDLYMIGHDGAEGQSPWENWGGEHFRFLITYNVDVFQISFPEGERSPYTWHIWYKDMDDAAAEWQLCVTKPDSRFGWSDTRVLFRVPTYGCGMTDLHTNDGARNDYEFVIAIYADADESLVCFSDSKNIPVTDAYEMQLADAIAAGADMSGDGLPANGVLSLAPDGVPGTPDGRNPAVVDGVLTAYFSFMNDGVGIDLADDCAIDFSVTRADGSVVAGSAQLDRAFDAIHTDNGYIGVRFDLGFTPEIYETISFEFSFNDRKGKTFTLPQTSFTNTITFLGLDSAAFSSLADKGINVDVRDDEVLFTGPVNGHNYTLDLELNKWAGLTKASQVVICAELFFDVYPPMYERFGAAGGSPDSVTLAIENEGYGIASTGGNFVHLHDAFLYANKNDYDCLTHEFAHVIQYGWDGNYCEVSGYIEQFADAARFLYATKGGKYNDLGWSIAAEDSGSVRTASTRFLLWFDYFYSTEDNDLLLKFFTACKSKQFGSNRWANAWTQIFAGSGLEGKTADEAYAMFLESDFATLSTVNTDGVSPLLAVYGVRAKAGRGDSDPVCALYFPIGNNAAVTGYTSSWSATIAGQTWELEKFNNNNNAFNYVKCGSALGNTAVIRTTIDRAISSFVLDFGKLNAVTITGMSLTVSREGEELVVLPLAIKEGRQVVFIPEAYRGEGLTYTFSFVTKKSGNTGATGAIRLDRIIARPADAARHTEDEPQINTAEWAEYVYRNGSGLYEDFEQRRVGLYNVEHSGASKGCAWENGGSPSQLQFLCKMGNSIFDLRFADGTTPKYTWTIWYKDIDDPNDSFKSIVTKPWSTYDFGEDTLYRVPTYRDGMTDLHTDGGEENVYEFVIVVTDDATGELICFSELYVGVTDSYEMYKSEQNI